MALPKILKPKYNVPLKRYGRDNDGGYLVSEKTVNLSKSLISFGILDDCSFEKSFLEKNKVEINCYDHTVGKNYWKKRIFNDLGAALFNLNFSYFKNTLIRFKEFKNFFKKKNNFLHIETIRKGSLRKIIEDKKPVNPIFIKIDIEGSEYRILNEILEYQEKFCAVIIEFHDVDLHLEKICNFTQKLNLELTHIHPNNYGLIGEKDIPSVIELTYEKNPEKKNHEVILPNNVDQPNNPLSKDIELKFED